MVSKLKFAIGNAKLKRGEIIFSLPAGYTCPFAKDCKSRCNPKTGKVIDGKDIKYRCYAASFECYRPNVRKVHWHNFNLLRRRTRVAMAQLINDSLPHSLICRIHDSGDFFSQAYFDAWIEIALNYPNRIFYAYTKALPFWVNRLNVIPKNFKLTASWGGTHNHLIRQHNLKNVHVVFSLKEARQWKLTLDHDDSHALEGDCHEFAHLLHGTQPAGTEASKVWYRLRGSKNGGYRR